MLRRFLWLGTDTVYKSAVEAISRKRAALRNLSVTEQINDFARAEPVKALGQLRPLAIDEEDWTKRVRALSGIFDRYPEVRSSSVDLEAGQGGTYLVNSEGAEIRTPEGTTYMRVRASAQAPDGMTVRDSAVFHALDPTRMALEPEMRRAAATVAGNVVALSKAPRGEDYSGPVLFEGVAAAQLFAEILGKNFALPRRPVMEPGRPGSSPTSELEGRQGARILPEGFTITDDPTQKEWRGRPLFGSYEIDREGIPARPLQLVDKGVLKGFLLTRQPVRGFEGSNGRARLPGSYGAQAAAISNLFVSAAETVPPAELKKQLLETVRSRNKPYGILVRKMDYPSSASFDEARRLLSGGQSGSSRPVSMPLLVYKVYPDGREELVRGLSFGEASLRDLRDVSAAGRDTSVLSRTSSSGAPAPFSVVAPEVLFPELELRPDGGATPKPALLSNPYFEKKAAGKAGRSRVAPVPGVKSCIVGGQRREEW